MNGLTTVLTYPAGGETRTTPGMGTVTTTHMDGQVEDVSGPGVVASHCAPTIVNGLLHEKVTRGQRRGGDECGGALRARADGAGEDRAAGQCVAGLPV